MNNNRSAVLALYPNMQGFGYALFANPKELLDSRMVPVYTMKHRRALERIICCIEYYVPTMIVLKDTATSDLRHTRRIKRLIADIDDYCQKKSIAVQHYSYEQTNTVFAKFKAKSKYEIAETIVRWVPQLAHKLPKRRKITNCEDYRQGMFDALALAYTHFYLTD